MAKFVSAVVLVALSLAVSNLAPATGSHMTLKSVLQESNKPVSLVKISLVRQLIEQSDDDQCDQCLKYKESLKELDSILSVAQSGKVCNLGMVDKIRQFHEKYIAQAAEKPIAPAFRQFFLSLCFQISAECKMALVNNLEYDTKEAITPDDYDQIHFLERYGATLLAFDDEIQDFDDIILLGDYLNRDPTSNNAHNRIIVKTKTNNMLKGLLRNCELKFKPFYEKLILPLIQLSNMGYNYQGELLERELEELKHNTFVRRWYNILQTCEAFRAIEIYEDREASESITSGDKQVLTFIGPLEADVLRSKQVKSIGDEINQELSSEQEKPIEYEPVASHNTDELWIKGQSELNKLVQKYKNNASETKRLRAKVLKRIFAKVKELIMSGSFHMVASEILSCTRRSNDCQTEEVDVKRELINMVDEAVEINEQEQLEEKGLESLDQAVALAGKRPGGVRPIGIPAKAKYVPEKKDQTKTRTKLFSGFLTRFFPSKWDIFFAYVFFIGFMFIIMGAILSVSIG